MPSVTPASIQEQLAEYRRRRQEEEAKLLHQSSPPSPTSSSNTDSSTVSASTSSNISAGGAASPPQPPGVCSVVLGGLLSSLRSVTSAVTGRLYAAVAPDHLLLEDRRGRRRGGHVLREHLAAGGVVEGEGAGVRRRNFVAMNAIAEDSLMENGPAQQDTVAPLLSNSNRTDQGHHDTEDSDEEELHEAMKKSRTKRWLLILGLKIVLWLLVFKVFIMWEFGAVFFLFSGFVLIGSNLRSGSRSPHEVSAYSVFNRDLRPIHGTVTPEQLQREMLFAM